MQAIVGAFKDTSEPKQIQMSGLHVAGQKYMTIRADDSSIYLKQVRDPSFTTCLHCDLDGKSRTI